MTTVSAPAASESALYAVVTRADGTVEHLGMIAYWHKNPLKRFAWRVKQRTLRPLTHFLRTGY